MTDITLDAPLLEHLLDAPGDPSGAPRAGVRWAMRDGERVVVKFASGRDRTRLRREAEALRHLRTARVVELVDLHEDESTTSLVLAHFGHRTLAEPTGANDEVLLRALQRCCEAVAELHRRGWTHGQLVPEHVLLGARGTVRLCSLGDARSSRDRDDAMERDLHGLVDITRSIAVELDGRKSARAVHRLAEEHSRSELASAQELAERIQELRLQSRRPRGLLTGALRSWIPTLLDVRGSVAAKVAAAGLGAALLVGGTQFARAATLDAHPSAAAGRASPASTRSRSAAGRTDPRPPTAEGAAPTVTLHGSRYRVGLPGDLPVVGDWDCDGTPTVRLLRPATGEVFEFMETPSGVQPATAQVVAVTAGGVAVRAEVDGSRSGCHHTMVVSDDGTERRIP